MNHHLIEVPKKGNNDRFFFLFVVALPWISSSITRSRSSKRQEWGNNRKTGGRKMAQKRWITELDEGRIKSQKCSVLIDKWGSKNRKGKIFPSVASFQPGLLSWLRERNKEWIFKTPSKVPPLNAYLNVHLSLVEDATFLLKLGLSDCWGPEGQSGHLNLRMPRRKREREDQYPWQTG